MDPLKVVEWIRKNPETAARKWRRSNDRITRCQELLKELEWSARIESYSQFCPICEGREEPLYHRGEKQVVGHAPNCRLAALLKELEDG